MLVCVNYSDYLKQSLEYNSKLFPIIYVATIEGDHTTLAVASQYDCRLIVYNDDIIHMNGAAFNKSIMVHHMQLFVHEKHPDSWMLLTDADVIIRDLADLTTLSKDTIYGASRLHYANKTALDLNAGETEDRYPTPSGYHQLYFDKTKLYPKYSYECCACDIQFADRFPAKQFLPLTVAHLGVSSVNWQGRVTSQWE